MMGAKKKEWGTLIGIRVPSQLAGRIDGLVQTGLYRNRAEVFLTALRISLAQLEKEAGIPTSE